MTKKDLLTIWGYLESYKMDLEKGLRMYQNLLTHKDLLTEADRAVITEKLVEDNKRNIAEIKRLQGLIEAAAPIEE